MSAVTAWLVHAYFPLAARHLLVDAIAHGTHAPGGHAGARGPVSFIAA